MASSILYAFQASWMKAQTRSWKCRPVSSGLLLILVALMACKSDIDNLGLITFCLCSGTSSIIRGTDPLHFVAAI